MVLFTVTPLPKEASCESTQSFEELGSVCPHSNAEAKQELTLPTSDEKKNINLNDITNLITL